MSVNTMVTDDMRSASTAGEYNTSELRESVQQKIAECWTSMEIDPSFTVSLVGCGATGSAAAFLLARVESVRELRLIDHDVIEPHNLMGQSMPGGVRPGTPKAKALATAIQAIRPDLRVVPIVDRVENRPAGEVFGATVVFSNLDGQAARRYTVEQAWQFGVPVIDCGVLAQGRLVRVTLYAPEPELACVICGIDPAVGGVSEQTYPCAGDEAAVTPAPTNAPAWLGTMAASLQVAELEKVVRPGPSRLLVGQELLMDVRFHRQYISWLPRNPACPFHHHPWAIEKLECTPGDLSLAKAFALTLPPGTRTGGNLPRWLRGTNLSLSVPTKQFVRSVQCGECGHRRSLLRLRHRLRESDLACPRGHGEMLQIPHDIVDRLYATCLDRELSQSLYSIGLKGADLFTISGPHGDRHFLLRGSGAGAGSPGRQGGLPDDEPGAAAPVRSAHCPQGCP